jgi:protein-S-isoprenylcysteine O-methyltransferase Ste14
MEWGLRFLPLAFALSFISILLGLRGLRFRQQFGHSPFRFPRSDDVSAGAFLSRMLVAFLALVVLLGIAAAAIPDWLDRFDPLYRHRRGDTLVVGAILISIGGALVWRAQHDMGRAWRVGIDPALRTELITGGLFRFCRNPIYLGLQIGLLGFCSCLPSYFMVTLLVAAWLCFQVQARLEEAHLISQYDDVYVDYCRRVGRFLPWTGRFKTPPSAAEGNRHVS